MSKPRVVVIGYGWWGRLCHCTLIKLADGLELHGVATQDSAKRPRIESEQGCRAYDDYQSAFADPNVDAVVIATPNHTHADLTVQALNADKHVVCDKVMCLTLPDCDRMIAASQDSGRHLTVFQNRRLDDDYLTLRRALSNGLLGDVRWLEMAWQGFGSWGGWRGRADSGGGRFYDLGAHLADQLAMLFPERITSVYARMHYDFPHTDVESEALLIVGFEGGKTGVCDLSSLAAVSKPRFYAHGTLGTYVQHGLDPQENALKAGDIDAAMPDIEHEARIHGKDGDIPVERVPGRWRGFYENWADVLTHGATPLVTLPEARRTIAIIDAARRSAQTGAAVPLDLPPAQ